MGEVPFWLRLIDAAIVALWLFTLLFVIWVIVAPDEKKARAQYWLVRAHFFKELVGKDAWQAPSAGADRSVQLSTIKVLRPVTGAIAFINLVTAAVLALAGIWLSTLSVETGSIIKVLVLAVAPLLALLALHSLLLLLLLNRNYKLLMDRDDDKDG
jgi:hypothetical protein